MNDPSATWFCERPDLVLVRFTGKDVLPFLQSKLAADTRRWRRDGGGYAVATDINGKVLFDGDFAFDGSTVFAVIAAELADAAIGHLEGYVIMEDVTIARDEMSAIVTSAGPGTADLLGVTPDPDEPFAPLSCTFDGAGALAFRTPGAVAEAEHWNVCSSAAAQTAIVRALAVGATPLTPTELVAHEIAAGIPRIGRDFVAGQTIATEAGLWNGVSLSKGCYLGQEVLERLFSRGAAARRLVRITWPGDVVAPGTQLYVDDAEVGSVTSCIARDGIVHAIASVRRKALGGNPTIKLGPDGPPVALGEFIGGPTPESP